MMNPLSAVCPRFLNGRTGCCLLVAVGIHAAVLSLEVPETSPGPIGGLERLTLRLSSASVPTAKKGGGREVAETTKRPSPAVAEDQSYMGASGEKRTTRREKNVLKTSPPAVKRIPKRAAAVATFQKPDRIEPLSRPEMDIDPANDLEGYAPPEDTDKGGDRHRKAETASLFKGIPVDEGSIHGTSETIGSSERLITHARPQYKENIPPDYPRLAQRRGHEGLTKLNVEVLDTGWVGRIEVAASSGFEVLDRAALEAVKQWRFVPGTVNKKRSIQWVIVPVRFALH